MNWEEIKENSFDPFGFNITQNLITRSQEVSVVRGCNSVQVINFGDAQVMFNGITLFPSATPATVVGDTLSFGGNLGEIYKGNINIMFGAGVTPRAMIIQKFYTEFDS